MLAVYTYNRPIYLEHIFTDDNSEDGQNYDPEDDAYDGDEDISEEEKLSMMREGNCYIHMLYTPIYYTIPSCMHICSSIYY